MRNILTLILIIFLFTVSCSGDKGCADGFFNWKGTCKKITVADVKVFDKSVQDLSNDISDEQNSSVKDSEIFDITTETDDMLIDKTNKDDVETNVKKIGSSCKGDQQCPFTGSCLGWNEGYCSILDCPDINKCPAGSECFVLTEGMKACLKECKSESDCRQTDGYECKVLVGSKNENAQLCYPVDSDAGELAAPCKKSEQCKGDMFCNLSFPQGYCTQAFCSSDKPCEAGECVKLDNVPYCMKSCEQDSDCLYDGADVGLKCSTVKNILGKSKKVCHSGVTGKKIGEICLSGFECDSDYCLIVKKGKCAGSSDYCIDDSQCPDKNDFCLIQENEIAGICSETCSVSKNCPASSIVTFCASKGKTGECLPGCLSNIDCPIKKGMECTFGDPINASAPGGKGICFSLKKGEPGSECTSDTGCNSSHCLISDDSGIGYCVTDCPYQYNETCKFPTSCSEYSGDKLCMKRCETSENCPKGFSCAPIETGGKNYCVPKPNQ